MVRGIEQNIHMKTCYGTPPVLRGLTLGLHFFTFLTVLTTFFNLSKSAISSFFDENDEYPAITEAASGHFGYRKSISDFRIPLLFFKITSFYEV